MTIQTGISVLQARGKFSFAHVLTLLGVAAGGLGGVPATAAPPIVIKVPVKPSAPLEVEVSDMTLLPGQVLDWPKLWGTGVITVARGQIELTGEAGPIRLLVAGERVEVARGSVYKISNHSDQPAVLEITLLKKQGRPALPPAPQSPSAQP